VKLKIGIFDSGIGGFTILNSLLKTRKDVEVIYLADTKRIPFGNKNSKEIRVIAEDICCFFEDKNLDALLIACNTTNACALDILEKNLKIPCFDLINSASEIVNKQIIGILATQTTVRSSYYKNAISSKKENIQSEVFFILEGNARLTYNYNFDFYTIKKLKKNDWVGLISYLRNSPIEEVISITDINLLWIPDALIIKIINNKNPKFTIDIQLIEVIDLILKINKSEINDFSRIIEASKQLISNIKLKNNLNKYDVKNNIYIVIN